MNECPKGKIRNPKTNRCVKIDGEIGKSIRGVKTSKSKTGKKHKVPASTKTQRTKKTTSDECPDGKIRNPKTKRCVYADGKVGRRISQKIPASPKKLSPKPASPKKLSPKPASPKKLSPKLPKPASPKKLSPKLPKPASPKKLSPKLPKPASPKKLSPKPASPKKLSPKPASPKKLMIPMSKVKADKGGNLILTKNVKATSPKKLSPKPVSRKKLSPKIVSPKKTSTSKYKIGDLVKLVDKNDDVYVLIYKVKKPYKGGQSYVGMFLYPFKVALYAVKEREIAPTPLLTKLQIIELERRFHGAFNDRKTTSDPDIVDIWNAYKIWRKNNALDNKTLLTPLSVVTIRSKPRHIPVTLKIADPVEFPLSVRNKKRTLHRGLVYSVNVTAKGNTTYSIYFPSIPKSYKISAKDEGLKKISEPNLRSLLRSELNIHPTTSPEIQNAVNIFFRT